MIKNFLGGGSKYRFNCSSVEMKVYLDNAATTRLSEGAFEAMLPYLSGEKFGNASSSHAKGLEARVAIENSRNLVSKVFNVSPGEIFFTSGATEANNYIIRSAVDSLNISDIFSTKLEHSSIYETVLDLEKNKRIKTHWIKLSQYGEIDYEDLEKKINSKKNEKNLVSLSHVNSELGIVANLDKVDKILSRENVFFHLDITQSAGKCDINLKNYNIDFASASAHKFHGPKGIGLMYINSKNKIFPFLTGGSQERNIRPGTENVSAIVGMAAALEEGLIEEEKNFEKILELKNFAIKNLKKSKKIEIFECGNSKINFHTILPLKIEIDDPENLLLFRLSSKGVYLSAGSACSSGVVKRSKVVEELFKNSGISFIRMSFSRYNSIEEVDYAIKSMEDCIY